MNEEVTQVIFVLDDDDAYLRFFQQAVEKHIKNIEIYTFNKTKDMLNHSKLKDVSLFAIDIELENENGFDVAKELSKDHDVPMLFMSGKENYNFEYFEDSDLTYDFIRKPLDVNICINRIKVLLKVSKVYKTHVIEKKRLQLSLKELLDYTNLYMVVLDDNMRVKLCSYLLATDLGFNSEADILGKEWAEFLESPIQHQMRTVHKKMISSPSKFKDKYREVTNNIITKNKNQILVKWFNSTIENSKTYTFSIGIPINRQITPDEEIETIRAYWNDIIDKDVTTINALKTVVEE